MGHFSAGVTDGISKLYNFTSLDCFSENCISSWHKCMPLSGKVIEAILQYSIWFESLKIQLFTE